MNPEIAVEKAEKERIEKPAEKKEGETQFLAVREFSEGVLRKHRPIIKAIWLITPEEFAKARNLTVIILLNDVQRIDHLTKKQVEVAALAAQKKAREKYRIDITPTFHLLSNYWDMLRHGSPTTYSEIRHGLPVYDPAGFFVPLKKLLDEGKIPGTKEAMRSLISRAPMRLKRVRFLFKTRVLEHIYGAVVDAAQAALISVGVAPPAPKQISEKVKAHLVKKRLLEPEYARYCSDVIRYWKDVEHGKVTEVPGAKLDELMSKGLFFVGRIERLLQGPRAKAKTGRTS